LFYSFNVIGPHWIGADYQSIENPGYNAARGPVNISVRARIEL
jgi:high affinity Mn2+ porin